MGEEIPMDVIRFIQEQWGCKEPFCEINFPKETWNALCDQAYRDLKTRCRYPRPMPFCIRLVGQSGSGKTSQLAPAVAFALEVQSQGYVSLAVRDFVSYHPHLKTIREHYGEGQVREKTNAFALTLLTLVLHRCICDRLPIVLEVTLLSPIYERLIHENLQQQKYHCDYHCLAIAQQTSNAWIESRFRETKRVVSKRSSDFFFQILEPAFKELQSIQMPNRVFVWDAFHTEPWITHFPDATLWQTIVQLRMQSLPPLSFEAALESKKAFLRDFYQQHPLGMS